MKDSGGKKKQVLQELQGLNRNICSSQPIEWMKRSTWHLITIFRAQTGSLMLHSGVSYMLNKWILIIVLKGTLQSCNKCTGNKIDFWSIWILCPISSRKQWRNKICTQRQDEKNLWHSEIEDMKSKYNLDTGLSG